MIEAVADLWNEPCDARCITTNGFIKANGYLVMGAGTAGQAQERFPKFPKIAGAQVRKFGNIVHAFHSTDLRNNTMFESDEDMWYITFPVKHVFFANADIDLIERSAKQLMMLLDNPDFPSILSKVLLPRPGCGHGFLKWEDVKPVIEPILDDRVWVIDKP